MTVAARCHVLGRPSAQASKRLSVYDFIDYGMTDDGLGHREFFTEDQRAASTPIASSEELNLKQQRELQLRFQAVSATSSANFSDGFIYPSVLRGRPLRLR